MFDTFALMSISLALGSVLGYAIEKIRHDKVEKELEKTKGELQKAKENLARVTDWWSGDM